MTFFSRKSSVYSYISAFIFFSCTYFSDPDNQKYYNFVHSPLYPHAPVTVLPGIGKTYGERLCQNGYIYAWQVLRQYLLFNKNEWLFKQWLKEICRVYLRMNERWIHYCYIGLYNWCTQHLWFNENEWSLNQWLTNNQECMNQQYYCTSEGHQMFNIYMCSA